MNNDAIDATFREAGTAVAVRQEDDAASPALFGTSDPIEIVQKAVRVADALKAVVVSKGLIANIGGKPYPQVEAWLTLAAMLRLTTICEWTRPIEDGWEARVYVRDANGNTVGAAEAQCLKTERSKKGWESFAIRSQAQTRATSKALRSVLGFIMVLSGFKATPAEEMDFEPPTPPSQPSSAPRGMTKNEAAAAKATAGGACVECNAPVGKPHATACKVGRPPDPGRPQQAEADARRSEPQERAERADAPMLTLVAEPSPTGRVGCLKGCSAGGHAKDCANGPMSENQRGLLFALHGDLKHDDVARHAFYEAVAGVRSSRELTRATAKLTIDALRAEKEAGL